jgi:hypothetical protein
MTSQRGVKRRVIQKAADANGAPTISFRAPLASRRRTESSGAEARFVEGALSDMNVRPPKEKEGPLARKRRGFGMTKKEWGVRREPQDPPLQKPNRKDGAPSTSRPTRANPSGTQTARRDVRFARAGGAARARCPPRNGGREQRVSCPYGRRDGPPQKDWPYTGEEKSRRARGLALRYTDGTRANSTRRRIGSMRSARTRTRSPSFQMSGARSLRRLERLRRGPPDSPMATMA